MNAKLGAFTFEVSKILANKHIMKTCFIANLLVPIYIIYDKYE